MPGKPRLIVLTTTYPRYAGDSGPSFVQGLVRELRAAFDVTVLAPHAAGAATDELLDGVRVRRFRYLPVAWQRLAYHGGIVPKIRRSPWLAWQIPFLVGGMFVALVRELRRRDADVIHAHWVLPQGLVALAARRLCGSSARVVTTSHGSDLFALDVPMMRALTRRVMERADAVTVVSTAMARHVRERLGVRRAVTVSPMGVDVEHTFVARTPGHARAGVVFVGRLAPGKGCETLLEAVGLLRQRGIEPELTIIGDGTERRALEGLARGLGIDSKTTFTGTMTATEVAAAFNAARVAVMPSSRPEGLGLVAAEALASGCITITSDIEAVRDVHDCDALKFPPGDAEALAGRLEFALTADSEAAQLSEAMRRRVVERFRWRAVGEAYARVLAGEPTSGTGPQR